MIFLKSLYTDIYDFWHKVGYCLSEDNKEQ